MHAGATIAIVIIIDNNNDDDDDKELRRDMEQLASVTTSISRWIYRRNDNDNDARPLEPSSLSSPGQEGFSHHAIVVENECRNEFCRYCHALERSLRWEGYYTTLVNIYVLVLFNVVVW